MMSRVICSFQRVGRKPWGYVTVVSCPLVSAHPETGPLRDDSWPWHQALSFGLLRLLQLNTGNCRQHKSISHNSGVWKAEVSVPYRQCSWVLWASSSHLNSDIEEERSGEILNKNINSRALHPYDLISSGGFTPWHHHTCAKDFSMGISAWEFQSTDVLPCSVAGCELNWPNQLPRDLPHSPFRLQPSFLLLE